MDLIGPQTVLAALPNAVCGLYWKAEGPVMSDSGAAILADRSFADAPARPTVLLVPGGGEGALALLHDAEVLAWLRSVGARSQWITSVCSGSLLLGAAGLLDGYRATSHWAVRAALAQFGAVPTEGRVVIDRNRMTGGGVTAGIDFGLRLAALLSCPHLARTIQLQMEYAPEPPFDAGTPETAGPDVTQAALASYDLTAASRLIGQAAQRFASGGA